MTRLVALAALALLACGCTDAPRPAMVGTPVPRAPLPLEPASSVLPTCSTLFAAGRPTPPAAATATCLMTNGQPLIVPAVPCADGGALWQVSGPGITTAGWARAGQPFQATDDLQDPAWLAALADCTGGA